MKTEIGEIVDYLRDPSGHTQWLLDQEVAALLTSAETRARDLLTRHIEALNLLTKRPARAGNHHRRPGPRPAPCHEPRPAPSLRPRG